jgi:hypothetical protein
VSVKGFLDDFYEKKRHEFYSHVRPWIAIGAEMAKAAGWKMTYAQYCALINLLDGMNSYERKVLLPVIDDLAVCELAVFYNQASELGDLEIATTYDQAVQRELAPLLVKRLRESANWIKVARQYAGEWTHLKKSVAGQQKRADKAEAEHLLVQKDLFKAWEERDIARKQTATWEIQAQDLRDQLVQAKSELAALKAAEPTYPCFACGRPMETRLCWECAR